MDALDGVIYLVPAAQVRGMARYLSAAPDRNLRPVLKPLIGYGYVCE